MTELNAAAIVGQPLKNGWSHVIIDLPQELVCAFSVEGKNANNVGRDLAESIQSHKLKNAKDIHHLLLDLLRKTRSSNNNLQLALAFKKSSSIIFATYRGTIFLKRNLENNNFKIGQILHSESEPKIIVGEIRLNDLVVLSSNNSEAIKSKLKAEVSDYEQIDQISASLSTLINQQKNSALTAIGLIYFDSEKKKKIIQNQDQAEPTFRENETKITQENKPKKIKIKLKKQWVEKLIKIGTQFFLLALKFIKRLFKKAVNTILSLDLKQINKPQNFISLLKDKIKLKKSEFTNGLCLNQDKKKRAIKIAIATALLIALVFGGYKFYQQKLIKQQQTIRDEISTALELVAEAKKLEDNQIILARKQTQQALELLTAKAKKYQDNKIASKIINNELSEINSFYQTISGENQLNQLEIFFDLREISPNFSTSNTAANSDYLFFLDQGQQQLIQYGLKNRLGELINLKDEVQAKDIAANANGLFILGKGIHQLDPENKDSDSQLSLIKSEGDSDRDANLISSFSSYLYVFNPEKRNIYRYIVDDENELSEPIGWLVSKQAIDFKNIIDMSVDGFIWLSDDQNKIIKLSKGEPVSDFTITGLEPELGSNAHLTTDLDQEQILILDSDNERLVILNQNGEFVKQIVSPSLAGTKQIVLLSQEETALVVSGSIIYSLKLNY